MLRHAVVLSTFVEAEEWIASRDNMTDWGASQICIEMSFDQISPCEDSTLHSLYLCGYSMMCTHVLCSCL